MSPGNGPCKDDGSAKARQHHLCVNVLHALPLTLRHPCALAVDILISLQNVKDRVSLKVNFLKLQVK